MGLGLTILASSQPYGADCESSGSSGASRLDDKQKRPRFPCFADARSTTDLVMLVATAAWIGYYNLRVTGDALRMPYLVHHATYQMWPLFLWQEPGLEPTYRHKVLRDFYVDRSAVYVEPARSRAFEAWRE